MLSWLEAYPKVVLKRLRREPDPMRQPRIAIILDENTSTGGTRYEAAKGYFRTVSEAGGPPIFNCAKALQTVNCSVFILDG